MENSNLLNLYIFLSFYNVKNLNGFFLKTFKNKDASLFTCKQRWLRMPNVFYLCYHK